MQEKINIIDKGIDNLFSYNFAIFWQSSTLNPPSARALFNYEASEQR